jgi:transcription elongation factor GreA
MADPIHYVSPESLQALKNEYEQIKNQTIPDIAKRIDEAKQQGDLSENAEYHQAREDMSWAQGRLLEVEQIINNSKLITHEKTGSVAVGSKVRVKVGANEREYTIVGPQEVSPAKGFISNESPLGSSLIGHKIGEKVNVDIPAGKQVYQILSIE